MLGLGRRDPLDPVGLRRFHLQGLPFLVKDQRLPGIELSGAPKSSAASGRCTKAKSPSLLGDAIPRLVGFHEELERVGRRAVSREGRAHYVARPVVGVPTVGCPSPATAGWRGTD